jgi:hypothetical protein
VTGAASRAEHLRKLVTLGAYLDEIDESVHSIQYDLAMPGAWDKARVADVTLRARAWLDGLGNGGAPTSEERASGAAGAAGAGEERPQA